MDFQTSVKTCLNKYADFSGRARRSEYWWFALANFLGGIALSIVDGVLGTGFLSPIWSLALLLPSLAVGARRLHDLDKSGWWLLLAFIPVIGVIILIVWFATQGTRGPNRFGPDPLAGEHGGSSVPPVAQA